MNIILLRCKRMFSKVIWWGGYDLPSELRCSHNSKTTDSEL